MSTLILKICTVPSTEAGRAIYKLGDLSGDGVYKAMMHLQHQKNGTEFLPLNQHQIIAMSLVVIDGDKVSSQVVGDEKTSEAEMLLLLAKHLESADNLVCWGGSDFDLPVIGYRLLKHGIACPAFWDRDSFEEGSVETLNLLDVLSGFSVAAEASFDEMVQVLDLADGMGLNSLDVLELYQEGNLQAIRQACDIDASNTYLIYLKYQKTRGGVTKTEYDRLSEQFKQQLTASAQPHLKQFAAASWAVQQ